MKKYVKPFLIVFAIYCFAMIALWRANVSYVDDVGRAVIGYGWTSDFNRYSSSLLSFFLIHMNLKLLDISPLPQIIAAAMMAVANVAIVYLLCGKKIKMLPLIGSCLLGLSPFMVTCLTYKFDAPCMAMAVLVSVLPFLWWPGNEKKIAPRKKWLIFGTMSFVGLMVMWTSYQAFSGVYVAVCLALALSKLLDGGDFKTVLRQAGFCIIPYILAAVVYKFCMPEVVGYRTTEMLALSEIIPGLFQNIGNLFSTVWEFLATSWKIMLVLIAVSAVVSLAIKYRKITKVLLGIFGLALITIFSFGAYLVISGTPTEARAMAGISIAFSIVAIFVTRNLEGKWQLLAAPTMVLLYMFVVFSFAFSNALADQQRYGDFRNELLVSDLAVLYPDRETAGEKRVQIQGTIGYSAVAAHVAEQFPILSDSLGMPQQGLTEHVWGTKKFQFYYNIGMENYPEYFERFDCAGTMTMKLDTLYHKIYESDDERTICVELK